MTEPPTLCSSSASAIRIRTPQPSPPECASSEKNIASTEASTSSSSVGPAAILAAAFQSPRTVRASRAPTAEGWAGAAYAGGPGGAAGAGGCPGTGGLGGGGGPSGAGGAAACRSRPQPMQKRASGGEAEPQSGQNDDTADSGEIKGQHEQLPRANVGTSLPHAWFPSVRSR
ncbi:hypothetical protein [Streptomyces sp. NPDC058989]|uniref:hypothetical protein n=1 Tax=Streptomyces sp. NPDC058989 TaxID=3346686 RepID=UPI0036A0CC84